MLVARRATRSEVMDHYCDDTAGIIVPPMISLLSTSGLRSIPVILTRKRSQIEYGPFNTLEEANSVVESINSAWEDYCNDLEA